jgi:hypothetical protein
VKEIHLEPEVPVQFRAIPRHIAITILEAIHPAPTAEQVA